jgi:hypothetical protein
VNAPFLFQDDQEENLEPAVEETRTHLGHLFILMDLTILTINTGQDEASHVPTANCVERVISILSVRRTQVLHLQTTMITKKK